MMSKQLSHFYEFGAFRLDILNRLLLRDGELVPLKPKVIDTLFVLVQNSGRVLSKDELLNAVWLDSFVEEGNLTQNIYVLRKTLGESNGEVRYIETIPKRGYRFVAPVSELMPDGAELKTDQRTKEEAVHAQSKEKQTEQAQPFEASTFVPAAPADSDDRTQSSRRVLYVAAILLASAVTALAFIWISGKPTQPASAATTSVKSIAVLPFKSLATTENDELMGAGMADALIAKLGSVKKFTVLPMSAARKYTNQETDALAVGRKLGADSVLDGTIQHAGERIRVTVQLLRTRDGASLWTGQFDQNLTDVFAVQDSISEQVARALTLKLSGEEREQLRKHYTDDAEAYQAYLKGRYFWNKRTVEGYNKGVEYFQQSINRDPNYALAYAGLADCYMRLNERGLPLIEGTMPRAKTAVMRALQIDDKLAEAHATLGFIKFRFEWDFPGAEREYKRAIELDPNYSIAHQWYAFYLLLMDRQPEALAQLERAREIDPLSLNIGSGFGTYFFFTRQYDRAIEELKKTVEMDSSFAEAHWMLALTYEQQAMYEQSLAELRRLQELAASDSLDVNATLAHLLAASGKSKEARKLLAELQTPVQQRYVSPYNLAVIYHALGDNEQSFALLEKAYSERSLRPVWLKFDPRLESIHADPRFADLMKRVGLIR